MSTLSQLKETSEYKALQALQEERERLCNETDGGLLFLGIVGMIMKSWNKKKRNKRIQEIDKELEQYRGLIEQLEAAEQAVRQNERKKLLESFAASEYANGYIIVYGRRTQLGGNEWDSFENARVAYVQKFGAMNGHQYKDYEIEEFVATLSVDGQPTMQTDKETTFYKIPVSPGLHTLSISGHGQLSVGGRSRFETTLEDKLDISAGSKFVLFNLKIRPVTGRGPESLLSVTTYDDFDLFAEDVGISSVGALGK